MAKRPVKMLTAMAGADFSYLPGDVVDVDEAIAASWLEAGIAGEPPIAHVAERNLGVAQDRVLELEGDLADVIADRDVLKGQAEQLGAQLAEISAERDGLASKVAEIEPTAAKVPDLEKRIAELEAKAAKPAKTAKPAA